MEEETKKQSFELVEETKEMTLKSTVIYTN